MSQKYTKEEAQAIAAWRENDLLTANTSIPTESAQPNDSGKMGLLIKIENYFYELPNEAD